MKDKPLLLEIESPVNYTQLAPGMYTVNCPGMFDPENSENHFMCASLKGNEGIYNSAFIGMLMPYFVHNANNLMVGVMGNLDLADIFMPDTEKVGPKLSAARNATNNVVEFLRDLSDSFPSDDCTAFTGDDVERSLVLIRSACGRSVSFEGPESADLAATLPCGSAAKATAALSGIAAWVVVSLGGMGTISYFSGGGKLTFRWARPEGCGKSHMPGSGNGAAILSLAGGLAASAGLALVVENYTKNGGEVSLVFNK